MIGDVWLASGQSNMEYRMGSDLLNKDVAKTVNMVLDLVNVKTTEAKKALEFKKLSESKPVEFIRLIEDKDIKNDEEIERTKSE